MGKHDIMTPKAISNKIKAKGRQKIKWYCQMCAKQFRDDNGFKCHCMSEGHRRQMEIFGQNPNWFIDGYSLQFEADFLDLLKRSHRFSRIAAPVVYNEYIGDRHHIHMNATRWGTLTEFVQHLGRTGKCKVEETLKGWFITYNSDDDREKMKKKRLRRDDSAVDEERDIKKQILRAEQMQMGNEASEQPLVRTDEKVVISLASSSSSFKWISKDKLVSSSKLVFEEPEPETNFSGSQSVKVMKGPTGGVSALDDLIKEEEKARESINRKDYWLCEGIVVKIMSKALAEKGYYKQKGVVRKVIDNYVGEIEMLESKHVLRVDQEELETVIPQIGCLVRIVNGAYRGSNARLLLVDTGRFSAEVKIEKGIYEGRVLKDVDYEDISKIG